MKPSVFTWLNPTHTEPVIGGVSIWTTSVSHSKACANFTEPLGLESYQRWFVLSYYKLRYCHPTKFPDLFVWLFLLCRSNQKVFCLFAIFLWRNNHSPDHDHAEHQCTAFLTQSVLCDCHGLVHSCLLCFCIFGPYWVCCRQLLYQCSNGKSQKEDIKSPPGNFNCSSAERKASWNTSAGIWLNVL